MIEQVLAAVALALCALLLARLMLGPRRRSRLDAGFAHTFGRLQRGTRALRTHIRAAWRWRTARREAERVADEAIRRARDGSSGLGKGDDDDDDGAIDGNVIKPKSFRGPRKPH